jgi:hypothetical protein
MRLGPAGHRGHHTGPALAAADLDGFHAQMRDYARLGIEEVHVMPIRHKIADWVESVCVPAVGRLADLDVAR